MTTRRVAPGLARVTRVTRLALAACSAALAACAGLPSAPPPQLSGRLTLQVAAHDGQPARGVNAAFDLVGDARAGELRLSTPLGPQLASARWSPGEATLRTADGETRHADLASLAQQVLGEPLPLQALPDWLQGRAWDGAPSTPVAGGFEQLGWTLDLARWGEGFVVARRNAPPPVTLRVRVDPR